jgi:hypothetical protein
MQVLLPLCLFQDGKADLALVVEKEREGRCYRGNTVLTLDMAYSNASLLARNAACSLAERGAARAALVYSMAYTARCEHSDALSDFSHHPQQTANQLRVS